MKNDNEAFRSQEAIYKHYKETAEKEKQYEEDNH